jgi:hypothetical protein
MGVMVSELLDKRAAAGEAEWQMPHGTDFNMFQLAAAHRQTHPLDGD